MDQPASTAKIAPFLRNYQLDTTEFADPPDSFRSFNEFFFRKLKPAARPVDPDPAAAVLPADGRHLAFADSSRISGVFVKGQSFDLTGLTGESALADRFRGGALVLSRLCPVDYHRFHFPAAGTPGPAREIAGSLFSVSPIALRNQLAYLWQNKRVLTLLDSPRLGAIAIIEIGATCVGSIRQTFTPGQPVAKGAEKGYFAFGGSSVVTLFEPGRIRLADDLVRHSAHQTEVYARFGSVLGHAQHH
jgi:phosphatidylserine decarboxylase